METQGRDFFQPILMVSILIISSSMTIITPEFSKSVLQESEEHRFTNGNQSSTPYVLPPGVSSPWHNETPHLFDIEYDGSILSPINYSAVSKSFSEFHVIRLSLPTNNNQVVKLYVEESPNQDNCRKFGNRYSGNINMYLLRTGIENRSNEANGYLIEYFNGHNWSMKGQIYGEWLNGSSINAWRLDFTGNSNTNSLDFQDWGISNHRGTKQFLNNSILIQDGFFNGITTIEQVHYRLLRMELLYDNSKMIDVCSTVIQAENILRNQLGIQLYIERSTSIGGPSPVLDNPSNVDCEIDNLTNSLVYYQYNKHQRWIPPNSPNGLRGNVSNYHFDSIDTVFYFGSINDLHINYSTILNQTGVPTTFGCGTSPIIQNQIRGIGVGWALMDHHQSQQWNSVHLFTQILLKLLGGTHTKSSMGYSIGIGGKICARDLNSVSPHHSIMHKSFHTTNRSSQLYLEIVHEGCYGILPILNLKNTNLISNITASLPFLHIQPDWTEHWRYRWSFFGDLKLRQWFMHAFDAIGNDSYYGIQGNPNYTSSSVGSDPIWRVRWIAERALWNISIWNQTNYWQNSLSISSWHTAVRTDVNNSNVNTDYWLGSCVHPNTSQNLSFGTTLGYANGWSHSFPNSNIYGSIHWGVMSCYPSSYLSYQATTYMPIPKYVNSTHSVIFLIAFPSIETNSIPWVPMSNVNFRHISLMWAQEN